MAGHSWDTRKEMKMKGTRMNTTVKVITTLIFLGTSVGCAGFALNWCDEAGSVAQREVGPNALLTKYMLLKEMHAQLEKKQADIKVYDVRFNEMKETYKGQPRSKWAREDREQYNLWATEVAGITASYNELAAQYNAKMAEVNWRFTNVGDLPQGATQTLPREYAPYKEQ